MRVTGYPVLAQRLSRFQVRYDAETVGTHAWPESLCQDGSRSHRRMRAYLQQRRPVSTTSVPGWDFPLLVPVARMVSTWIGPRCVDEMGVVMALRKLLRELVHSTSGRVPNSHVAWAPVVKTIFENRTIAVSFNSRFGNCHFKNCEFVWAGRAAGWRAAVFRDCVLDDCELGMPRAEFASYMIGGAINVSPPTRQQVIDDAVRRYYRHRPDAVARCLDSSNIWERHQLLAWVRVEYRKVLDRDRSQSDELAQFDELARFDELAPQSRPPQSLGAPAGRAFSWPSPRENTR
jgi:hypothetical protein